MCCGVQAQNYKDTEQLVRRRLTRITLMKFGIVKLMLTIIEPAVDKVQIFKTVMSSNSWLYIIEFWQCYSL